MIEVKTYPTEPITEENFQRTLLKKTYDFMETLENIWQKAANNIQKLQEKQKERHDNQLPEKPVEFKIGDKILLHRIKAEKQWKEILGNRAYKLRLNNKILIKAAHTLLSTSNILQLGVQKILVKPDKIPQDLEPIIIIEPNT
ncbi:hypothetical protein G9A89_009116 [Geosiphon pyriformis]|nr:hypothetical protein G9A89_009116 [Geosiphon pyriformis]